MTRAVLLLAPPPLLAASCYLLHAAGCRDAAGVCFFLAVTLFVFLGGLWLAGSPDRQGGAS